MTVVLQSLSAELAAAAERGARRSARRRRRARLAAIVAVAMLALLAAAVATGTLFWQPQLGNSSQGHPSASRSEVPAAQLALLGVLRRAQSDADRGAAARDAASWLGNEFRGVRTDSIRVLSNGAVLFSAQDGPSGKDSLCLFLADKEAGGISCTTTGRLRQGGLAILTMPAPDITFQAKDGKLVLRDGHPVPVPGSQPAPQPARVVGVVPDGVASVRFDSTTVAVRDNAYDAHLAPGEDPRRTLLNASGTPWHHG